MGTIHKIPKNAQTFCEIFEFFGTLSTEAENQCSPNCECLCEMNCCTGANWSILQTTINMQISKKTWEYVIVRRFLFKQVHKKRCLTVHFTRNSPPTKRLKFFGNNINKKEPRTVNRFFNEFQTHCNCVGSMVIVGTFVQPNVSCTVSSASLFHQPNGSKIL